MNIARGVLVATVLVMAPSLAYGDEGGLSFWLPGLYGSYAATPTTPGWSWATVYIHTSADAGAEAQFHAAAKWMSAYKAAGIWSRSVQPTHSKILSLAGNSR